MEVGEDVDHTLQISYKVMGGYLKMVWCYLGNAKIRELGEEDARIGMLLL